jgi:tetratricopeptide (TPR) repeat protein
VTRVAELIDSGIRAYTRGQLSEAERCWSEALAAEPTNARARSYLDVLLGRKDFAHPAGPAVSSPPAQPRAAEVDRPPVVARKHAAEPRLADEERRAAEVEQRSVGAEPGRDGAAAVPLPSPSLAAPPAAPAAPRATAPVPLPHPATQQAGMPPCTAAPPQADPWPPTAQPRQTTLSWITESDPSPSGGLEDDFAAAVPAVPAQALTGASPDATGGQIPAGTEEPSAMVQVANGRPERSTLNDYAPSPWDDGPAVTPAVVIGEGEGLDLETVADQSDLRPLVPEQGTIPQLFSLAPGNAVEVWMEGARELFALGDFSGSLEMLEKILKVDPSHEEARRYLKENESTLIAMYESKLGSRDAVPRLSISPEEVMWLNLDHRAGFLLAQIDGAITYEDLFALSGLPRLDTARILATLLQEGVIQSG